MPRCSGGDGIRIEHELEQRAPLEPLAAALERRAQLARMPGPEKGVAVQRSEPGEVERQRATAKRYKHKRST